MTTLTDRHEVIVVEHKADEVVRIEQRASLCLTHLGNLLRILPVDVGAFLRPFVSAECFVRQPQRCLCPLARYREPLSSHAHRQLHVGVRLQATVTIIITFNVVASAGFRTMGPLDSDWPSIVL